MVQKKKSEGPPRPRGRPPAYDRNRALARAAGAFWRTGYSGTSLDQLSDAMDMNRPSLYGAFGDKRSLYLEALDTYVAKARAGAEEIFAAEQSLAVALQRFYDAALDLYYPQGETPRGCFLVGTAAVESVADPEIRERLRAGLRSFERAIAARIRRAQDEGELGAENDADALATVAASVLYTIALRARAGEPRAVLSRVARATVQLICANGR